MGQCCGQAVHLRSESSLADRLDRRGEDVPRAAFGAYKRRLALIWLDLLAKPADLNVDGSIVDFVVMQPRQAEELVAREDPLWRGEERGEEVEFVVGESHQRAAR